MPFTSGVPTESYVLDTYHNSYGTLILVGDGAATGEVFHIIAGVGDIDGPGQSTNVRERLTHSTGSRYKGKDPGLIDAGSLKFPVNYEASNPSHSDTAGTLSFGLGYLFLTGKKRKFQIASSPNTDGTRDLRQFVGFVGEFGESHPVDGIDIRDTTIEIDGPITTLTPIPAPSA